MIEKLKKLEEKVLSAMTIKKNQLYIWQIERYRQQVKDWDILTHLSYMEKELSKSSYCEKTPSELWNEKFYGDNVFAMDTFDIHSMYYEWMRQEIVNVIGIILSSMKIEQKEYSTLGILYNKLNEAFTVYNWYKQGKHSSYWYDSPPYRDWKDKQSKNVDNIKKEFEKAYAFLEGTTDEKSQ